MIAQQTAVIIFEIHSEGKGSGGHGEGAEGDVVGGGAVILLVETFELADRFVGLGDIGLLILESLGGVGVLDLAGAGGAVVGLASTELKVYACYIIVFVFGAV